MTKVNLKNLLARKESEDGSILAAILEGVATPKTGDKERKVIKLAVTTAGKDAIEIVARRFDMKEYAVAGRIYEWFIAQDDIFQRAVLGLLQGLEVDAARAFMERLAASGGGKVVKDVHGAVIPPNPRKEGGRRTAQESSKRS